VHVSVIRTALYPVGCRTFKRPIIGGTANIPIQSICHLAGEIVDRINPGRMCARVGSSRREEFCVLVCRSTGTMWWQESERPILPKPLLGWLNRASANSWLCADTRVRGTPDRAVFCILVMGISSLLPRAKTTIKATLGFASQDVPTSSRTFPADELPIWS
jgi:hypothetical protein